VYVGVHYRSAHPVPVWTYLGDVAGMDAVELAQAFFRAQPGPVAAARTAVTDAYTTKHNGVTHVHLQQRVAGLPVANARANVNVRGAQVISAYSRFYDGDAPALVRPSLSAVQAATHLAQFLRVHAPTIIAGTRAHACLCLRAHVCIYVCVCASLSLCVCVCPDRD
jgi:hypothetical protein